MGTDNDWERWGATDPYFGVLSDERFRTGTLAGDARAEFFHSGEAHIGQVMQAIEARFGHAPSPGAVGSPGTELEFAL